MTLTYEMVLHLLISSSQIAFIIADKYNGTMAVDKYNGTIPPLQEIAVHRPEEVFPFIPGIIIGATIATVQIIGCGIFMVMKTYKHPPRPADENIEAGGEIDTKKSRSSHRTSSKHANKKRSQPEINTQNVTNTLDAEPKEETPALTAALTPGSALTLNEEPAADLPIEPNASTLTV